MPPSRRSALALLAGAGAKIGLSQSYFPGIPNIGFKDPTNERRTECGIGALMPWADALWAITYTAHQTPGPFDGAGLYRIDENFKSQCVNLHRNGANANRMVHAESN